MKDFLLFPFNVIFALSYTLLFFILGSIIWAIACVVIAITLFYGLIVAGVNVFNKILYGKDEEA